MKHAHVRWDIAGAILLGLIVLLFWLWRPHERPVPAFPEYPHQAHRLVQDEGHPYFYASDEVGLYRTTTFQSADTPAEVYEFYRAQMTQAGWPLVFDQRQEELRFEFWLATEPVPPPLLEKYIAVEIVISPTHGGQTEVSISEHHADGRRGDFMPPLP
jgi:hypothetical protein